MSDLIKKVKIKKQDNTYTDYIPIGAEAKNIDMKNGYSVQANIGDINIEKDGNIVEHFNDIYDKINTTFAFCSRIGRLNFTSYIKNGYYGMQGGCYVGNNQYIFAMIKNNDNGDATVMKVDFSTGTIIQTSEVSEIYHGNGACIKGSSIYFLQAFDNNHVNKYGIVEVDINTLTKKGVHVLNWNGIEPFHLLGLGYDEKEDKFYAIGGNYFIRISSTFLVEERITREKVNNKSALTHQGGTFYQDYVCVMLNNVNAVVCYDRKGKLHHVINIGSFQDGLNFGEIENVNVFDDTLYFNSNLTHTGDSNLKILQFFKSKLYGGGLPQEAYNNLTSFDSNTTKTISVNKTKYDTLDDYNKFTCDGSVNKPYENLAEAMCYINNNQYYVIDLGGNQIFPENVNITNKNLCIKGNHATVGVLKIVGSTVTLTNLRIGHSVYKTPLVGSHSDWNTPLYITGGSSVWVTGTTGYNYNQCVEDGMRYSCIIEGSVLYDNGGSFEDNTYKKFLSNTNGYAPNLMGANIVSSNATGIKNNKNNFATYKDSSVKYKGTQTFSLTDIPLYTNNYRGFWLSLNLGSLGVTTLTKFSINCPLNFIVRDSTNGKYGFTCEFETGEGTLIIRPYSWDYTTNKWVADTTLEYYPFYEFEV